MITACKFTKLSLTLLLVVLIFCFTTPVFAEDPTGTPTPTPDQSAKINDLQNQIKEYQNKISDLQSQGKTLSSQIEIMNSQVHLTELQIDSAKSKIAELGKDIDTAKNQISHLERNINSSTKALIGRISAVYQVGRINPWQVLLTSNNISNFLTRLTYLKMVQISDKKNIYAAEQSKVAYANEKDFLESKQLEEKEAQKSLEEYTDKLAQDKLAKQTLLDQTRGDEARYQKLLQQAQAQVSAFKSFASFAGGASILPPQASPDGWYYNQRDERWGNHGIGSSSEQVWDVGCLVTSITMVLKKHGQNVTPGDVASNSSYYFSNTAYMLIPWGGGKFSSVWSSNTSEIDSKLSSGEPVIVGLHAGAYGMHFVVFKSGSGGNYTINDPWYGPDMNFSDHYSTGQIFQYGWYNG